MALFGDSGAAGDYRSYALAGLLGTPGAPGQLGYLDQAKVPIQTAYTQGTAAWNPLVNPTLGGFNAYADITGAQGRAGQDRARALFQTDPGYQFAQDAAQQAVARANTGGYESSGNVLAALQDRSQQLANQQYNQYVQRLAPYLNLAPTVAGAQTGLAQWQGGNLANILGTQGNAWANTANAIGQNQAAADTANAATNANFWGNVIGAGVKLAGAGLGGPAGAAAGAAGGGGGLFSQLFGPSGAGGTGVFGSAGPVFGGTNPNAWYTR
jgi:hypothetical protein